MSEGLLIIGKDTEIRHTIQEHCGCSAGERMLWLKYRQRVFLRILRENSSTFAEKDRTEGSVFRLNCSEPFRNAVNAALSGKSLRQDMESGGQTYEIIANPAKDEHQITGAILIIMDVTEIERGERLRREFTSNVSHELKTPLTSIYGVSDMLQSGLVKDEDIKDFAGTIKKESSQIDIADRRYYQTVAAGRKHHPSGNGNCGFMGDHAAGSHAAFRQGRRKSGYCQVCRSSGKHTWGRVYRG